MDIGAGVALVSCSQVESAHAGNAFSIIGAEGASGYGLSTQLAGRTRVDEV